MDRDSVETGQVPQPPYFYGPFDTFQHIETRGFESDGWIEHCENHYRSMTRSSLGFNRFKNIIKALLFPPPILSYEVLELIAHGEAILDIGGGWGDNYFGMLLNGVYPSKGNYYVLDNEKQAGLGKKIFGEEDVRFVSDTPKRNFGLVLLIGTLQYIEDWASIFATLSQVNCKVCYIDRTPFVSTVPTFCVVQSIKPSTLAYKVGEENLHVINFDEFVSVCNDFGWSVKLVSSKVNYGNNFTRLPASHQNVFYQKVILESI